MLITNACAIGSFILSSLYSGACLANSCVRTKGARKLLSMCRSQLLRVAVSIVSCSKIDALFTNKLKLPPKASTARETKDCDCASSKRSACNATDFCPIASISDAVARAASADAA